MGTVTCLPGCVLFPVHLQHTSLAKWSSVSTGLAVDTSSFPPEKPDSHPKWKEEASLSKWQSLGVKGGDSQLCGSSGVYRGTIQNVTEVLCTDRRSSDLSTRDFKKKKLTKVRARPESPNTHRFIGSVKLHRLRDCFFPYLTLADISVFCCSNRIHETGRFIKKWSFFLLMALEAETFWSRQPQLLRLHTTSFFTEWVRWENNNSTTGKRRGVKEVQDILQQYANMNTKPSLRTEPPNTADSLNWKPNFKLRFCRDKLHPIIAPSVIVW